MINIIKDASGLILEYTPSGHNTSDWIDHSLKERGKVTIRKSFTFTKTDLISNKTPDDDSSEQNRYFKLGIIEDEYYKIDKHILNLKHDLRLHQEIEITHKFFIAERNISIFRKIDDLIEEDEPIIVGGDNENAINLDDFELLLKTFPTTTELNHYAGTRITHILKNYFGTMTDAEQKLAKFYKRKKKLKEKDKETVILDIEVKKFEYIHEELEEMLDGANSYSEHEWQNKIIDLLLLIFPQYIAVFKEVKILDMYSNPPARNREIDFMLIDANGYIDIIEIKKPAQADLISNTLYRDNHRGLAVLSGTVMQIEKYLFHLSKWGKEGEDALTKKYKSKLPDNFKLNITNPKAMLILGRDHNLTCQQKADFEFIRRQYKNIHDIITYDDLLRRVKSIIEMLKLKSKQKG